ncbi:MAG: response regulator transcription factor [Acidobacteria bacterium]|nr:response regulator transcription factor [Acidobacteriota bacterium]MCA1610941.1 response regulator transcription factor [Acidobacteriota bacterium]
MTKRILVIEDDRDIGRLLQIHLRDAGWEAELSADGQEGLERALAGGYDLVVLDLTLPRLGGLDVCRVLREQPVWVPILMLTARSSEVDRVRGLESGADDYLTKPFSVRELVARARALFRRVEATRGELKSHELTAGDLTIDAQKRQVLLIGKEVELTAREFDLLHHFAQHPGRVYTRSELLDAVWGYGHEGYSHTVNSHINRLRAKVEQDPSQPRYILTVWGVGYKFAETGGAKK